ncbi:MAG: hypothetical protein QM776_01225 [Rhodocyclaceae bacterium]
MLAAEGYDTVDPTHPLGGPDGGKDIVCKREDETCIVSIYFPRGQKDYAEISAKFRSDFEKTKSSGSAGFVFFTNQELTLGERAKLEDIAEGRWVDIYHLERIASCLDTPNGYGLRLEFLQIEMTREEQVSFINSRDQLLHEIHAAVLKKPEARPPETIKTVRIQQPDLFDSLSALTGTKLVECRKCQEIFRATRNALLAIVDPNSLSVVTCPSCGHTQRFQ